MNEVRTRWSWQPVAAVALALAALAPVLVIVVTRSGRDWFPVQDLAVIDARVRDVWSSDIPLVGPYSRGFNHPGPLVFWLLALPSAVAGGAAWGTMVGGALLQGVAIVATARLAWRRGGLGLELLVLAALLLSYPGAFMFLHPWNPNIAFPFLPLYLLLVWSVATGERSKLVWAVVVGTFLVQTHIGYAVLVAVPAAWAAVVVWRDAGGRAALGPWRRPALLSAGVAAVLWAPVVLEQLVDPPGNLRRIYRYFAHTTDPRAGVRAAAGLLATEFRVPPPWLGGHDRFQTFSSDVEPSSLWWLLVPAVLVVVAVVLGRRSSRRTDARLVAVVGVALATALVAMAQLRGQLQPYLFLWRAVVAALFVGAVAWLALRVAQGRLGGWPWRLAGLLAAALLVGRSWTLSDDLARARVGHVLPYEPVASALYDQLADRLPSRPVLVRGSGLGGLPEAIVDKLDRDGAPVRVDRRLAYKWGEHRVARAASVDRIWYVVQSGLAMSAATGVPGARVLATRSPLRPAEEARAATLERRLLRQLQDAGRGRDAEDLDSTLAEFVFTDVPGIDRPALTELAKLNAVLQRRGGCRCAVVAVPPDAPGLDDLPDVLDAAG